MGLWRCQAVPKAQAVQRELSRACLQRGVATGWQVRAVPGALPGAQQGLGAAAQGCSRSRILLLASLILIRFMCSPCPSLPRPLWVHPLRGECDTPVLGHSSELCTDGELLCTPNLCPVEGSRAEGANGCCAPSSALAGPEGVNSECHLRHCLCRTEAGWHWQQNNATFSELWLPSRGEGGHERVRN